jgi:transposase
MSRFIEGEGRTQSMLFPERLDDWVVEDNPVRVVDAFVEELDLESLGFARSCPASTGRPGYHPATLLKIYAYGYLNRVQSSRRLAARGSTQYRADVAHGASCAGLQDDRRLPTRQR